jgi:DNA anti-recombination protein RmuC
MSWNDTLSKVLAQARELQRSAAEAVNRTAEDLKPQVQQSLEHAQELQETLARHATESGQVAAEQSQVLLGHLGEYVKIGQQALREGVEQTRAAAVQMTEQAKKVVDAAAAAAKDKGPTGGEKPPGD